MVDVNASTGRDNLDVSAAAAAAFASVLTFAGLNALQIGQGRLGQGQHGQRPLTDKVLLDFKNYCFFFSIDFLMLEVHTFLFL